MPKAGFSYCCSTKTTPDGLNKRVVCHVCGSEISKRHIQRHMLLHGVGKYRCAECNLDFETQPEYKAHNKEKHQKSVLCPHCGKTYDSKRPLSEHIKVKHTFSAKFFPCSICPTKFTRVGALRTHMNAVHLNIKPFACRCGKSFSNKSHCRRHTEKCSGIGGEEVVHRCGVCSQVFAGKASLNNHMRGMHDAPGYYCSCGQAFKWRSTLGKHRKTCPGGVGLSSSDFPALAEATVQLAAVNSETEDL